MLVWVIRHAEAEHSAGRHDHERALTPTGAEQSGRLARYLARRSPASLIVSSPILRARQTSETIRAAMPEATIRFSDAASTSGSAREAIDTLRTLHVPVCIVVSHEPLTSQLVGRLASGDDALRIRFTPCTAVLLDLGAHLRAGHGQIIECVTPETLQSTPEH